MARSSDAVSLEAKYAPSAESPRPRVLLGHENPDVQAQLTRLLTPSFRVMAAHGDGKSLLHEFTRIMPDFVVLDTSFVGEMTGIELAREMRSRHPSKIVFVTAQDDCDLLAAAIGSGGSACVLRSCLEHELDMAMQQALSGELYISEAILSQVGKKR